MHLKALFVKSQPFCLGLNEFSHGYGEGGFIADISGWVFQVMLQGGNICRLESTGDIGLTHELGK